MPGGAYGILSWVLVIAVFYIFMILPEKKRQKNMKNMINSLKIGDRILTRGGIYGTIVTTSEDSVVIESGPDNVKLEMAKGSIGTVLESTNDVVEESTESEEKSE